MTMSYTDLIARVESLPQVSVMGNKYLIETVVGLKEMQIGDYGYGMFSLWIYAEGEYLFKCETLTAEALLERISRFVSRKKYFETLRMSSKSELEKFQELGSLLKMNEVDCEHDYEGRDYGITRNMKKVVVGYTLWEYDVNNDIYVELASARAINTFIKLCGLLIAE